MIQVATMDVLEEGKLKLVRADHARVAIVRTGTAVRAVSAICTHARIFLAPGLLGRDGLIECPSHGAKFSPVDGSVRCPPAIKPLTVFEVVVRDNLVFVDPGLPPAASPDLRPGARSAQAARKSSHNPGRSSSRR